MNNLTKKEKTERKVKIEHRNGKIRYIGTVKLDFPELTKEIMNDRKFGDC